MGESHAGDKWKPWEKHSTPFIVFCAIGGVILILILSSVSYFALKARKYRKLIDQELNAVRKAGEPVTLSEAESLYPEIPTEENGALVLLQAFEKFSDAGPEGLPVVGEGKLPELDEPLPEEMKKGIATFLDANKEFLELARKGLALKRRRYPVDLKQGIEVKLDHFGPLRQAARVFELQAVMQGEEGQPDKAAESVICMLGLGRTVTDEPFVISQLVRIAIDFMAMTPLQRVLSRNAVNDVVLRQLCDVVERQRKAGGMYQALVVERCVGLDIFDILEKGPSSGSPVAKRLFGPGTRYKPGLFLLVLYPDKYEYLKIMRELIDISRMPFQARYNAAKTLDIEQELKDLRIPCIVCAMLLPASELLSGKECQHEAQMLVTQTALQVERFRLAKGRLPESLAALVPDYMQTVPLDPFDGQPLRYKKLPKGYIVYSVGLNGKDDGGVASWQSIEAPRDADDRSFTVLRRSGPLRATAGSENTVHCVRRPPNA